MSCSSVGAGSRIALARDFATTRWSRVLAAGQATSPTQSEALEALCQTYWGPIYVFLRREGLDHADAQDMTQMFLAHLLARNPFANLSPEKGLFRTFLLRCLRHFLADQRDQAMAAKRGGRQVVVSLEQAARELAEEQDVSPSATAESAFDRRWALTVMNNALVHLEEEFRAAGKDEFFQHLKPFLSQEAQPGDYAALARRLGLSSGTIPVMVHRLRRRYGELVRDEVAQTVTTSADLEAELGYLIQLMCQAGSSAFADSSSCPKSV